jgi:hypothetical protein
MISLNTLGTVKTLVPLFHPHGLWLVEPNFHLLILYVGGGGETNYGRGYVTTLAPYQRHVISADKSA